ncbi:peptidyl-tRNA hydrolase 2, mitochondrial-like [Choristoneura fumiferana]|uniref:peptidyl-tRNA hydrolase 2, mitochondrial-like n=1 Tax=Choristoneura fumiferana TaxID=7141 RepID=UPI003D15BE43
MSEVNAFLGGFITGVCLFTLFVVIKRNWWRLRRSPRVADAPTTREFSATTEYILTLIVRADMSLANKKMASHCSHASVMAFDNLLSADPQAARFWLYTGQKKMILAADSVDVINRMDDLARRLGLKTTFVCDDRTDPVGPTTVTVLGIGPGPKNVINRITYNLLLV